MSRPARALAIAALIVLVAGTAASALWLSSATGSGLSRALTVPAGAQPTTTLVGSDIDVSWATTNFPGATPIAGYTVTAYDIASTPRAPGGDCAGIVAATACTDTAVPSGTWTYTITPRHLAWVGTESAPSSPGIVVP